jgi:Uma2 family endonuclease
MQDPCGGVLARRLLMRRCHAVITALDDGSRHAMARGILMRMSSRTSHAGTELPGIDERLVAPESGYEIDDGRLIRVSPSDPPHAIRHSKISALLEAHAADGFEVACDMLTRLSETSDRAPDASVFPAAPDPATGRRQIEQLAFEVVSTETLSDAAKKARDLSTRGVRRVFAIDVERVRAFEWSAELGTWSVLDLAGSITDPALAVALPLDALVRAAKTDDAVARALLAKRNPVLVAAMEAAEAHGRAEGEAHGRAEGEAHGRAEGEAHGRAEGEAHGLARGKALMILRVLANRELVPTGADRDAILAECDHDRLDRWLDRALSCHSVDELLAGDR